MRSPKLRTLCTCPECNGAGTITCPECDGDGTYKFVNLADAPIPKGIANYEELIALKADARRVNLQAERLKQLVPARADSYEAQRVATIATIESQAEKLLR